MENPSVFCCLVAVSLLWGVTNPFIKAGSTGMDDVKRPDPLRQVLAQIVFLATNFRFIIPFLLNQLGSVIFLVTLGNADLSLAVPFVNALALVLTSLTGLFLGETLNKANVMGMSLVVAGVTVCVYANEIA